MTNGRRLIVDRRSTMGSGNAKPTSSSDMTEYGMFPVSVIIAGFCVMSVAYLICFCCCIIQFFVRRNRTLGASSRELPSNENGGARKQTNDKLKSYFFRQYANSLKRFNKNRPPNQLVADSSCVGFCPICFEEYKGDPADNFVGLIKTCGHFFHFDCIWEWLENHQTCPLCRGPAQLKESDVKGLALRHVAAYKECAMKQDKSGGDGKKSLDSSSCNIPVPSSLESTVQSPISSSSIVVSVDIEDNTGAGCLATPTTSSVGDAEESCSVDVAMPSGTGVNQTQGESSVNSVNRSCDQRQSKSHDNLGFVVEDETT